jgi:2-polyprenyl-3-methyl-5-hydroxy-6-metoxy-1,4-benzoquinol methylase
MILDNTLKYDDGKADDLTKLPNEHRKVTEWVGHNKNVLEIGCHTGTLSKCLLANNNAVTGIDINEDAVLMAKPFQKRTLVGDIETPETFAWLQDEKFEVITVLHILEHLTNPWRVLGKTIQYLNEDGIIIIGLPNIANAKTRLSIFKGNFIYEDIGVMDKTHLRFFNYKTAIEMIHDSGLEIVDYHSPWRSNPIKALIEHTPVLHKMKNVFSDKPMRMFSRNLTDVVMLFKCQLKH